MTQRYRGTGITHKGYMYYIGGFGGEWDDAYNLRATYYSNGNPGTFWSGGTEIPYGPLYNAPLGIRGRGNNEEICIFGGIQVNGLSYGDKPHTHNNTRGSRGKIYCITPQKLRQRTTTTAWQDRGNLPQQAEILSQIIRVTLP